MDKVNDCKETGHDWSPFNEFCAKCLMSFEDYRNGLDNKFRTKCQCGAEKAGFDSHAHYCPRSDKK